MKLTKNQASELEALKLYIERNFKKFNIEISINYISLQYKPCFIIMINGKSAILESELLAYTFLDGMYIGINR